MLQYLLRARFGDRESWGVREGDRFLLPAKPEQFPLDDPASGLRLWKERSKTALDWVEPPGAFLPPVPVRRIFCPAVNFRMHGKESHMEVPTEPYFFLKFASSVVPHGGSVVLPPQITQADYEGEIGIVVGTRGKHWSRNEAEDAIFGYTIVDDVSLRDYQFREAPRYGKNWVMGKAFDDSLPIGPWILAREEAPDFHFTIETKVNGELRQSGSTEDMIFGPGELLSYLSEVITLAPGDVITTGTPAGVAAHNDRRYLKPRDVVEVEVSRIGALRHLISVEPAGRPSG